MKKNKMMRLASGLLVAVLLTTSMISGTFAKYVTSATGSDSARVARWGVTITTTTSGLFEDTYGNEEIIGETAVGAGISVNSGNATDYVVAPGTSGRIQFSIAGTPEVAVKVEYDMTVTNDVIIPANTVVGGNALLSAYTPVVFTLNDGSSDIATGTLTSIQSTLNGLDGEYGVGESFAKTYTLSWVWPIETGSEADVIAANNEKDTYLGDVAAGKITNPDTKTNIAFSFTITATQID